MNRRFLFAVVMAPCAVLIAAWLWSWQSSKDNSQACPPNEISGDVLVDIQNIAEARILAEIREREIRFSQEQFDRNYRERMLIAVAQLALIEQEQFRDGAMVEAGHLLRLLNCNSADDFRQLVRIEYEDMPDQLGSDLYRPCLDKTHGAYHSTESFLNASLALYDREFPDPVD